MTVGVAVGVSVGGKVGSRVAVAVSLGGGKTNAVWVCAAPAVATTIVCMRPGSEVGFAPAGAERLGNAHPSVSANIASRNTSFCMERVFMFATASLPG